MAAPTQCGHGTGPLVLGRLCATAHQPTPAGEPVGPNAALPINGCQWSSAVRLVRHGQDHSGQTASRPSGDRQGRPGIHTHGRGRVGGYAVTQ